MRLFVSIFAGGSCISASSAVAAKENEAPTLTLRTTAAVGASVDVKKGTTYRMCDDGQDPTADAPCELGAVAVDGEDGDITAKVSKAHAAIQPASVFWRQCSCRFNCAAAVWASVCSTCRERLLSKAWGRSAPSMSPRFRLLAYNTATANGTYAAMSAADDFFIVA